MWPMPMPGCFFGLDWRSWIPISRICDYAWLIDSSALRIRVRRVERNQPKSRWQMWLTLSDILLRAKRPKKMDCHEIMAFGSLF